MTTTKEESVSRQQNDSQSVSSMQVPRDSLWQALQQCYDPNVCRSAVAPLVTGPISRSFLMAVLDEAIRECSSLDDLDDEKWEEGTPDRITASSERQ